MIGRRPEPVPGMEPGRWRVTWARGLPQTVRNKWVVSRGNCAGSVQFATWREALAYADRMARTREVVLPRNHDLKKSVHKDINGDLYANYGSASYWVQDNWNKGPKPLALALLALAEQEDTE